MTTTPGATGHVAGLAAGAGAPAGAGQAGQGPAAPPAFDAAAQGPVIEGYGTGESAPVAGPRLQALVEEIHATVELAAQQGAAQARIALSPPQLGGIRVHISQTAEGLLARLTPETPAGAQALSESHVELHRSLSSLGVPLLRMDIGSFSHSDAHPREQSFAGGSGQSSSARSSIAEEPSESQEVTETQASQSVAPLGGGLVNVLA